MTQVPDTLLAKVRAELSTAQLGDVLDTLGRRISSSARNRSAMLVPRWSAGDAAAGGRGDAGDHSFGLMFEALDSLGRTRSISLPPALRPSRSGRADDHPRAGAGRGGGRARRLHARHAGDTRHDAAGLRARLLRAGPARPGPGGGVSGAGSHRRSRRPARRPDRGRRRRRARGPERCRGGMRREGAGEAGAWENIIAQEIEAGLSTTEAWEKYGVM